MSKHTSPTSDEDQKLVNAWNSQKALFAKFRFKGLILTLVLVVALLSVFSQFYNEKRWLTFYETNYRGISDTHVGSYLSLAKQSLANNIDSIFNPVEIEKINININFENWEAIKAERKELLETWRHLSYLPNRNAAIDWKGKKYRAKVRLAGIGVDHREHPKKWTLSIKLKNDKYLKGMSEFKLYNPETRNYWSECLFLNSLRYNGVLAQACDYVDLYINGDRVGIMLQIENINKDLLERQGRKEGIIFKPDYESIWEELIRTGAHGKNDKTIFATGAERSHFVGNMNNIILNRLVHPLKFYSNKAISKSSVLTKQKEVAVKLYNAMLDSKIPVSQVLDVEKFGAALATVFFWGNYHSFEIHNLRFYFNPITYKFEPIPTDSSSTGKDHGSPNFETKVTGTNELFYWLTRSPEIRESFKRHVEMYVDSSKTDGIFGKKFENLKRNMLYKLLPDYRMLPQIYSGAFQDRYNAHKDSIATDTFFQNTPNIDTGVEFAPQVDFEIKDLLFAHIIKDDSGQYIKLLNRFPSHLVLRQLIATEGTIVTNLLEAIPADNLKHQNLLIPPTFRGFDLENGRRVGSLNFDLGNETFNSNTVFTGVVWLEAQNKEYKFAATPYFSNAKSNPLTPTPLAELSKKHTFLKFDSEGKTARIEKGNWMIKDFIKLPAGTSLVVEPGTVLEFEKDAGFLIRGHADLRGTLSEPISLKPINMAEGWAGFTVMNANQWDMGNRSKMQYVAITQTNEAHHGTWKLTGGTNFYNSDVNLEEVKFEKTMAEDALNIIHSNFLVKKVQISDSRSDAFDGDFVNGTVIDSQFIDVGGDAVDVSGSDIRVIDSTFDFVNDKAVSIGEASHAEVSGILVRSSGTGVASKDGSTGNIIDSTFENIQNATLMAYIKKPQYGGASLTAQNIKFDQNLNALVAQKKSQISIDGNSVLARKVDVDKLYKEGYMKK